MNKKLAKIRRVYWICAAMLVIWFGYANFGPTSAPGQVAYENWLSGILPKIQNIKPGDSGPDVGLNLISKDQAYNWSLVLDRSTNADKVARLLEMFKESKLLEIEKPTAPDLTLEVRSGTDKFAAVFSIRDLDTNPQAQSMLKLFQVYATGQVK